MSIKNNLGFIFRPRSSDTLLTQTKVSKRQHRDPAAFKKRHMVFTALMTASLMLALPVQGGANFTDQARLPADAKSTCTADISPWFVGGQVASNAPVNPANSLDPLFADGENNTQCDFFKWGSHMFLWLTSKTSPTNYTFNTSPTFYDVSVSIGGKRNFEKNDGVLDMAVRRVKSDDKIELGQAGGGDVLISQNNSLVYYSIHANNVFAMFATGRKKGKITDNNFPTTLEELAKIQAFATEYGYGHLDDSQALTMELKTSWVEASTVNPSKYLTTMADVPTFSCSKEGEPMNVSALRQSCPHGPWLNVGTKTTRLAMVGMHVVGPVNGHPEMVWATFEHYNNVPDNEYQYINQQGKAQTMAFNSYGNWNFLPNRAQKPVSIVTNAAVNSSDNSLEIKCVSNVSNKSCKAASVEIAPVDSIRMNPFGNNELNPNGTRANTDLISLNRSVLSQLYPGDVRGNYIQTGSIWTANGEIPPSQPYVFPPAEIEKGTVPSSDDITEQLRQTYLRGSMFAANSTMETFHQFSQSSSNAAVELQNANCFACHGGNTHNSDPGYATDSIDSSHIFDDMNPLPKKQF